MALLGITRFMATVHDTLTSRGGEAEVRGTASPPVPGGDATIAPARPAPSSPAGAIPEAAPAATLLVGTLRERRLTIPVQGIAPSALVASFRSPRGGGSRAHEALDIMAPAGTPVLAVEDGLVARLFTSEAGGLTIYQFDPSGTVAYYYAHLDRYAPGLRDGAPLRRGQVIGYVGSSGNADREAPHLHFAIFRLGPERRWWEGEAIDPYLVFGPDR